MHKKRRFRAALVNGMLLGSVCGVASAQTHVVKKPETVVRAVGVYEWTGSETKPTASRFVPVTLFIDGHLEDAAVYLARPVPFALQTGTIFELEHAGVPEGTLELSFARHMVSTGDTPLDDGWLGFGSYKPLKQPKETATKLRAGTISQVEVSGGKSRTSFNNQPAASKPVATPSTSTTTDNSTDPDRPTLNRKTGNPADTAPPATGTGAATQTSGQTGTQTPSQPSDDADRPTMKRRPASGAGTDTATTPATQSSDSTQAASSSAADPAPATSTAADPDRPTMKRPDDAKTSSDDDRASEADPERPTLRRRTDAQRQAARKEHDSSSVRGSTASLNDDPDRPNLHRGKPAGALNDDDLPALKGLPADVHRAVGVSDAANRKEHDFTRAWEDEAERAAVRSRMQEFARSLLAGYQAGPAPTAPAANGAGAPPAVRPVPRTTSVAQRKAALARNKTAVKTPSASTLSDEELRGYTLSYGGAATYVYSASSTGSDGLVRYVSVVAQREPNGELKVALSNVTDSAHLDRTPRLELVDAVDAEASNRASLLFEARAQNSRQFALYRVIGAESQQTFATGSTQ